MTASSCAASVWSFGRAVAQLPVAAQLLEGLVELEEGRVVGLDQRTDGLGLRRQLLGVDLPALRGELPERPRLAEEGDLVGLEVRQVLLDLVGLDGGEVGQHVDLREPLDAQRVEDPEAGVGVVRHTERNGTSAAPAGSEAFAAGPGEDGPTPHRGRATPLRGDHRA